MPKVCSKSWPEEPYWTIRLTPKLSALIAEFRKTLSIYPTLPDAGDRIDWLGFEILRDVLFQRRTAVVASPESRIREAALYLQQHYEEKCSLDEVARKFGFSRAVFYRCWRKVMKDSPNQFLLQQRLLAAARLLYQTRLSAAAVVRAVNFAGQTAFFRKFQEYFQLTPAEFRTLPEEQLRRFPELELPELHQEEKGSRKLRLPLNEE